MSNVWFPFSDPYQTNSSGTIPYDLIINEAFPGMVLEPTEPNGVYVAFREVSGCAWWVLNADWNSTDNQWEQVSPQNAALPAYALEQCADGTVNRYVAAATNIPGTPVNWVSVWSIDQYGNQLVNPQVSTVASQIGQHVAVSWSTTNSTQMSATQLNVTDTLSASSSLIENLIVNGTPKWQVRKDGTLVTGIIPFARITGFVIPSGTTLDGCTFTGTSTFNGPVVMNNGLTVTGGETVDSLHVTGNEQVDGTLTTNNLTVTGTPNFPAGTVPTTINGASGINVTHSGSTYVISGVNLVASLTSTDGSVGLVHSGQNYNLSVVSLPYVQGAQYRLQVRPTNSGSGSTNTLTLPTLPGNGSNSYQVYAYSSCDTTPGNSQTMTGSGATWEASSVTVPDAGAVGPEPIDYIGTATGGQAPSVTYTVTGGLGSTGYQGVFYILAYSVP